MQTLALSGVHRFIRPHPALLGRARAAVHRQLATARVDEECLHRAVIVCDELLSNVMEHVDGVAVLSVSVTPELVCVAVADPGSRRRAGDWRTGPTSGLTLVGKLSRTFSVRSSGDGTTVAAEIARHGRL